MGNEDWCLVDLAGYFELILLEIGWCNHPLATCTRILAIYYPLPDQVSI